MEEIQQIRDEWFKDHIAKLTQQGDLQILEWSRLKSNHYFYRYVFDEYNLYVTSNIGDAIFNLTWKADVHSFNDIDIDYFYIRLSAYSKEKVDFNANEAVRQLKIWSKEIKERGTIYDQCEMKDLFKQTKDCCNQCEWTEIVNSHNELISSLDQDYWKWFYNVGDSIPTNIYAYLIGLQMASEQLRKKGYNHIKHDKRYKWQSFGEATEKEVYKI